MGKKMELRPEWSTIVLPYEYDIDEQMRQWLLAANEEKKDYFGIDVGKMWGLYQSWKEAQKLLHMLGLGVSLGDECPFCGSKNRHSNICYFGQWLEENTKKA